MLGLRGDYIFVFFFFFLGLRVVLQAHWAKNDLHGLSLSWEMFVFSAVVCIVHKTHDYGEIWDSTSRQHFTLKFPFLN